MSDYYSSLYAHESGTHFSLCGSRQPGISNQESSEDPACFTFHPSVDNGGFHAHFNSGFGTPFNANAGDTFSASHPSSRRERRGRKPGDIATQEDEYWKDGRPIDEVYKHGDFILNMPIRAVATAPLLHKQAIYAQTVSKIEGATGRFTAKYEALRHRLEPLCHDAQLAVDAATAGLLEFRHQAYTITSPIITDTTGTPITLGGGPNLSNDTKKNGIFLRFTLSFNPRAQVIPPELGIDSTKFPAASTRRVFVELPRNDDATEIHASFEYDMFRQKPRYKDILNVFEEANAPFTLLATRRSSDTPDSETYDHWFHETIAKVRFAALKQAGRAYLGRMDGLKSLNDRLKTIDMKIYDPKVRRHTYMSVEALFQTFNVHLLEIDPTAPPKDLIDLATAFFDALTFELREQVHDQLPAVTSTDYLSNLARFRKMKKIAEDEERRVKRMVSIAQGTHARRQQPRFQQQGAPAAASKSFPALPPTPEHLPRPTNDSPYGTPGIRTAVADPGASQHGLPETFQTYFITAVSQAEEALQLASGTKYPRECWGCGAPGHTFGNNCPKRNDPECAKRYNQKMKEFIENRRNKKRQQGYYGNKGYFSQEIYDAIRTIETEDTEPTVRKTLLAKLADDIHTFLTSKHNKERKRSNTDVKGKPAVTTFVAFMTAHTFNRNLPLEFSINKLQPYMYFPIGPDLDNIAHLKGLYDTGGCCNMGWLIYHMEIAKRFPHMVKRVINLEQIREEPFSIGGIDGHVFITVIIEYYLPHKDGQDENYVIQIGLVDEFPLNTLFGLPFIIKADLVFHPARQVVTSSVFETEFKVEMERHHRVPVEDVAHNQQRGTQVYHMTEDVQQEETAYAGAIQSAAS